VRFNTNPDGEYYVTKEMKLLSVGESRVVVIGRVAKSDSERFPYIIYDDSGYRLYVHYSGAIVNKSGTVVGQMESRS